MPITFYVFQTSKRKDQYKSVLEIGRYETAEEVADYVMKNITTDPHNGDKIMIVPKKYVEIFEFVATPVLVQTKLANTD